MLYTTIVVYKREGDKVVPYRLSQFHGYVPPGRGMHIRKLDWAEIYGNHTSWVADQIAQSQSYRKAA